MSKNFFDAIEIEARRLRLGDALEETVAEMRLSAFRGTIQVWRLTASIPCDWGGGCQEKHESAFLAADETVALSKGKDLLREHMARMEKIREIVYKVERVYDRDTIPDAPRRFSYAGDPAGTFDLNQWRAELGLPVETCPSEAGQAEWFATLRANTVAAQQYIDEIGGCRDKYAPLIRELDQLLDKRCLSMREEVFSSVRIWAQGPNTHPHGPCISHAVRDHAFETSFKLAFDGQEYRWTAGDIEELKIAVAKRILADDMAVKRIAYAIFRNDGRIVASHVTYTTWGFGGAPTGHDSARCFFVEYHYPVGKKYDRREEYPGEEIGGLHHPFFAAVIKKYRDICKKHKKAGVLRCVSPDGGDLPDVEVP